MVPLLYIAGLEPKTAAATSSIVVTFSGTSSFLSHIFTSATPNWTVWLLCVISVLSGSQLGSRFMAERLKHKAVKRVFGIVLLMVSGILIVKDVLLK